MANVIEKIENFPIFKTLEDMIIGKTEFFFDKVIHLVNYVSPFIMVGIGIYIILQAYHYYGRGLDETILDISRRMVGWILIAMLALNASNYEHIAKTVYKLPDEIASSFNGTELKANALDTNRKQSDAIMKEIGNKGEKTYGGGLLKVPDGKYLVFMAWWYFAKLFIGAFLLFIFIFYLIAKVSLLVTLMVGPIFIGCLFFPNTRHWGMNWVNQIFSYTVTILMYMILISIQQNFFDSFILGLLNNVKNGEGLALTAKISGFGLIMCMSLFTFIIVGLKIPQIAASLTGGNPQMNVGGVVRTIMSIKTLGLGKGGAVSNGGK